ncbi:MAG: hypothetical protein AAGH46_01095 [Bacteroidota bacterium]
MKLPESFEKLIDKAQKDMLYKALVLQLNKDLRCANIDQEYPDDIAPEELKEQLDRRLKYLMEFEFDTYLNLLYIVDVS